MATLNRAAAEAMTEIGVRAGTDVTGFGLLGHLHEMADASGCAALLDIAAVPLFDRATMELAEDGVVPGRTAEIVAWADGFTRWDSTFGRDVWMRVLCDPQTSGGMLMAVPQDRVAALTEALESRDALAAIVGRFADGECGIVAAS
jgi:selenide,water dikinase